MMVELEVGWYVELKVGWWSWRGDGGVGGVLVELEVGW